MNFLDKYEKTEFGRPMYPLELVYLCDPFAAGYGLSSPNGAPATAWDEVLCIERSLIQISS